MQAVALPTWCAVYALSDWSSTALGGKYITPSAGEADARAKWIGLVTRESDSVGAALVAGVSRHWCAWYARSKQSELL